MNELIKALPAETVREYLNADAWILDTRPADVFIHGFVPGAVFIDMEDDLPAVVSWLDPCLPENIILITSPGQEQQVYARLIAAGARRICGYLSGGMDRWLSENGSSDMLIEIEADELAMDIPHDRRLEIIDVRLPEDFKEAHIQGATSIPFPEFADTLTIAGINEDHNLYFMDDGSGKGITTACLLKRHGYHQLRYVKGGFEKARQTKGIPVVVERPNQT